ncbi:MULTISPECIES: coiled-coil domain-containing protein [unclassified Endozoicomonas]|uniref:coiled-coil domain-containing protein n=1 Tax=unclassified Endozoicomonas TaxID=2644528 RepID=UPI003BB11A86
MLHQPLYTALLEAGVSDETAKAGAQIEWHVTESRLDRIEKNLSIVGSDTAALKDGQKKLDSRMDKLEAKVDRLEDGQKKLDSRMDKLETKVDKLETKVDRLEDGQKKLDSRMDKLECSQEILVSDHRKIVTKLEEHDVKLELILDCVKNIMDNT